MECEKSIANTNLEMCHPKSRTQCVWELTLKFDVGYGLNYLGKDKCEKE